MNEETDKTGLLDEDFLRRLEQLDLVVRKAASGKLRGERRARKRGVGVDFSDYRRYVHGDDPRFIDWNIYGRLETLFLKLFVEEEDLDLHLLLDSSGSMAFGEPPKFGFAVRLAAALASIGLTGQSRVSIHLFSSARPPSLGPLRGRRNRMRLFEFLSGLTPEGGTDLAASARRWALAEPRKGIAVLLGDFLDPGDGETLGLEAALPFFGGRFLDVHAVQVLSPDEMRPPFKGELKLIDGEEDRFTDVSMGEPILKRYRDNLEGFLARVRDRCVGRGIPYLLATSDSSFERVVLDALRRGGVLR